MKGIGSFCKYSKEISLWEGERVEIESVCVNSYEIHVKNQFV